MQIFLTYLNQVYQLELVLLLLKIGFISFDRIRIPRANNLAIVAAINSIANSLPELNGYDTFQLNSQVGNTPLRIENIRSDYGICRTDIDTTSASAAMIISRLR